MLKHFLRENEVRDFSVLAFPVKNNRHRLVFEMILNCVFCAFVGGFLVHFTHYTEKTK